VVVDPEVTGAERETERERERERERSWYKEKKTMIDSENINCHKDCK
jgi:hypothetical protein